MAEKILAFRVDVIGVSEESKEITKLDQQLKNLNKTQKEIVKARDKGNISAKKSEQLLTQLSSRSQDLRVKRQQLVKVERDQARAFQASAGSVNALDLRMKSLQAQMRKLNLTTAEGQKKWRQLNAELQKGQATLQKYNGRLSGSQRLQGAFSKGILQSAKSMATAYIGITTIVRGVQDLIKVTGDFDSATAKLAATTGQTREEIEDLTEQAKFLGATTVFTASQVTDLQIELAKLGFTADDIQNSTEAVLNLAAATEADLGQAAKVAGVAVKAFGLDTLEAGNAAATLAVATTKSALAFEDYETILSTVGPVAKSYGLSLEDTIALTGRLKDAGFDASSAATATRNILLNLADANGELAQTLGGSVNTLDGLVDGLVALDDKGIGLAKTLELTDKRSVSAFNTFLKGAEDARNLRDGITDVNDELQDMVDQRLDSFAGDVKALGSAWEGFLLSLKASGAIREVTQFLKDAILQVSNLGLAFRKFHKQTEEQLGRSFDLLNSLSNKQGQEFRAVVEQLDEINFAELSLDPDDYAAAFAEIRNVNEKESAALAAEYIRRRHERNREEFAIARATQERIARDEVDLQKKADADKLEADKEAAEEAAKIEKQRTKDFIAENRQRLKETEAIRDSLDEANEESNEALVELMDDWLDQQQSQMMLELELDQQRYDAELRAWKEKEQEKTDFEKEQEAQRQQIRQQAWRAYDNAWELVYTIQRNRMDAELEQAGDNAKKREEIEKKYAEKQRRIALIEAIISTALAVTNALGSGPPPLNFVLAGVTAAAGALEVATIASQKFAKGGKVKTGNELPGSRRGEDNTLALVKPGEAVVNEHQQIKLGGPKAFARAGVPGFAGGGMVGGPAPSTSRIDSDIATRKMYGDMKVWLNVNELQSAEKELEVINDTSGL